MGELKRATKTLSALEDSLQEKNSQIASTLKNMTMGLTPARKPKLSQKEELKLAQERAAAESSEPEWIKRVKAGSRSGAIKEIEKNREKALEEAASSSPSPDWVKKAKEAQISRDLRGLERFVNQKAPALPPAPEWISKACKRRDLSSLLGYEERVHESNKEAPSWVQSSNAQKILNSFLRDDEGVIPQWMRKGVEMTRDEKKLFLLQLKELKELLEAERQLTAERETILAESKDALQLAEKKLDESVTAYRTLRENRKNPDNEIVQGYVEEVNSIFNNSSAFMEKTKKKFDLEDSVKELVEVQGRKLAESRSKSTKAKKTKRKKKLELKVQGETSVDSPSPRKSDKTRRRKKDTPAEERKKKKIKS